MTLKLIEHGSMFLHLYIFLSFFFVLYNKKNVSSLFTVYPCRVCEQTNGEQEEEKKESKTERKKKFWNPIIERECV